MALTAALVLSGLLAGRPPEDPGGNGDFDECFSFGHLGVPGGRQPAGPIVFLNTAVFINSRWGLHNEHTI